MVAVPPPPNAKALTDKDGRITNGWSQFIQSLYKRTGGSADAVQAAHDLAAAASPSTHRIIAGAGLDGGGVLTGDVTVRQYVFTGMVSGLPATAAPGSWAYATDARNSGEGGGAGTGCPVCWNGAHWRIPGVSTTVAA